MNKRIRSIDILRGLTIALMVLVNNPGSWGSVYSPLLHADWHGYTPTDLVFPFFLFIVGTSIAFSYRNKKPSGSTYKKILFRTLKLIALGIFLGGFLLQFPFFKSWEVLRLPGVLQRIGLGFCFAALLSLHMNWKWLVVTTATLLIGYWVWLGFIPLPNGLPSSFDRVPENWAMFVDSNLLGTHMWKQDYDPEGLMSTIPSVATALIGVLTGRYLISKKHNKHINLLGAGVTLLVLGYIWSLSFPINKALWTSSFVLVTAGWALIVLSIVYYITDIRQIKLGKIFQYAGANALAIYFLNSFIANSFGQIKVGDTSLHGWLYETIYVHSFIPAKLSSLLYALTVVSFFLGLGWVLYKRKLFIKV